MLRKFLAYVLNREPDEIVFKSDTFSKPSTETCDSCKYCVPCPSFDTMAGQMRYARCVYNSYTIHTSRKYCEDTFGTKDCHYERKLNA